MNDENENASAQVQRSELREVRINSAEWSWVKSVANPMREAAAPWFGADVMVSEFVPDNRAVLVYRSGDFSIVKLREEATDGQ